MATNLKDIASKLDDESTHNNSLKKSSLSTVRNISSQRTLNFVSNPVSPTNFPGNN